METIIALNWAKEENIYCLAASIFNYAVVNMPVVCYYHAKAENPSASNTSTETTTQTTTKAS